MKGFPSIQNDQDSKQIYNRARKIYCLKVHVCLAVICHLHFWQNDRDLLCATVVTRGWNRYQNKSQNPELTLEKKILPLFLLGFFFKWINKKKQKNMNLLVVIFWGKAHIKKTPKKHKKSKRVAQLITFSSLKCWLQLQGAEPWKDHIKNKQTNKTTEK